MNSGSINTVMQWCSLESAHQCECPVQECLTIFTSNSSLHFNTFLMLCSHVGVKNSVALCRNGIHQRQHTAIAMLPCWQHYRKKVMISEKSFSNVDSLFKVLYFWNFFPGDPELQQWDVQHSWFSKILNSWCNFLSLLHWKQWKISFAAGVDHQQQKTSTHDNANKKHGNMLWNCMILLQSFQCFWFYLSCFLPSNLIQVFEYCVSADTEYWAFCIFIENITEQFC